jgi:uncharacterized protein
MQKGVFMKLMLILLTLIVGQNSWAACGPPMCNDTYPGNDSPPREVPRTLTGIALDAQWKIEVYNFALKNVRHSAWGIAHSERNFQVATKLAAAEYIKMDIDVLFASAFLHDLGGISGFEIKGVDHAVRSVELMQPLLSKWGFPMTKWDLVREMVLGHSYYEAPPASTQALVFRDADILDFLGTVGIARIMSITNEPGISDLTMKPTVNLLKSFSKSLVAKCSLSTCSELAKIRQVELDSFLASLSKATFNYQAL